MCRARIRCDEFRLDYYLQPGDIQLLNNHTCLHTRGAFTDFPVRPCARLSNAHVYVRCGDLIVHRQAWDRIVCMCPCAMLAGKRLL